MTMRVDKDQFSGIAREIRELHGHIHPPVPNPAPLGLFAFGLTTALLQVKHTRIGGDESEEIAGVEAIVLGFAMFFGGLLQIIAGLSETKRNNIFGYTAFLVYGGFWMSIATMDIIHLLAASDNHSIAPVNPKAVQAMLFLVGVISVIFWICTFKLNKTINFLFFLLTVTVFLLMAGVRNETVDKVAGWFGMATSACAYWLAFAELINDIHGEGKVEIIPLGHFKKGEFQHGGMHTQSRIQPAGPRHHMLASARDMFSRRQLHIEPNETTMQRVERLPRTLEDPEDPEEQIENA